MSKKIDKKKMSLEEFIERVKKYLKIIIQELKDQKERLDKLEKKMETLKADVDTVKTKLSMIERQAVPGISVPSPPAAAVESRRSEISLEIPPIGELELPAEEVSKPVSTRATVPPKPSVAAKEQKPSAVSEKLTSEEFDLEKYLERLEQLGELGKLGASEVPPVEELEIPEVSPESEEGKPVSSDELKKKEKDLLKALSELEFA